MTSGHQVQSILLRIQMAELPPEEATCDEGDDSHRAIVPYEQWVRRNRL